jgi:hypothetical protein
MAFDFPSNESSYEDLSQTSGWGDSQWVLLSLFPIAEADAGSTWKSVQTVVEAKCATLALPHRCRESRKTNEVV